MVLLQLLIISALAHFSHATMESALTFQVPARKEQCFYEDVKQNDEIELDFQVFFIL